MRSVALARLMRRIVGRRRVLDGRLDRALYAYDAGNAEGMPDMVVMPGTRDEAVRVIKAAADAAVAIVPRGAGTCLSGGPVPRDGGVVLALNRLNRILSLDAVGRLAIVEPGVINGALQAAAGQHGLGFMPDPSSLAISTLGGNAAENAGGPRAIQHGVFRRHVAGLEWVLADGTLVTTGILADGDTGDRPAANPAHLPGLNLDALVIGSEGTLGVITRLALRLEPLAAAKCTVLALYAEAEGAARAVAALAGANLSPAAAEIMGGLDIRLAADHTGLAIPSDVAAILLLEFDGPGPALPRLAEKAAAVARATGAISVETATDPTMRDRLWQARRSSTGFYGRVRPAFLSGDVTVPRSQVPALFRAVAEAEREHGLPIGIVGHAGDGNLHPAILFDPADASEVCAAHAADRAIIAATLELGGSLTGEHGIGIEKLPFMHQAFAEPVLDAFQAVKRAFDPAGRLNPGKAIPVGAARGTPDSSEVAKPRVRPAPQQALAILRKQLGDTVAIGAESLAAFGMANAGWRPLAVVSAKSTADVVRLVNAVRAAGARICPIGTGRHAPNVVDGSNDVVAVSLRRMDRLIAIHPDDLYCEVQPGYTAGALSNALCELRAVGGPSLSYAVEAARNPGSTLGGEVAMDIAGPGWRRHGPTHEQVLGLTWVNAHGEICELGSRTLKDVAGYDLTRLLCGSWGSLGIIAGIRLRLVPAPELTSTAVAICPDIASAGELACRLREQVDAEFVVVLPEGLAAVAEYADGRPAVVIALAGPREDVAHWSDMAARLCAAGSARYVALAGRAADIARAAALRSYAAGVDARLRRDHEPARASGDAAAILSRRLKGCLDPDGLFAPNHRDQRIAGAGSRR